MGGWGGAALGPSVTSDPGGAAHFPAGERRAGETGVDQSPQNLVLPGSPRSAEDRRG